MDIIGAWSRRLAERIVPHEADFAADVGQAYAAGGERRRNLFTSGRPSEAGGFAPGAGIGELPVILDGLRAITDVLASGLIGNALAVYALIQSRRAAPSSGSLGQDEEQLLDRALTALIERLKGHGYGEKKAEERAYQVLEVIFDPGNSPENIQELLSALAATAPALPPPRRRPSPGTMLPPWLWFYLIAYLLVGMPGLIHDWIRQADAYATLMANSPTGVARNAGILLSVATIAQIFPALVLLAGVLSVLQPRLNGRRAERRHALAPSDNPVIQEIAAFVAQHDPSITVTFSEHGGPAGAHLLIRPDQGTHRRIPPADDPVALRP